MSAKEGKQNVIILNRAEITTYPKLNKPLKVIMVTYIAAGMPPRTLNIIKTKYTLEHEKKLVKADIERRKKIKTEKYQV